MGAVVQLLMSSDRFDSKLPWAGFNASLPLVKTLVKIILTASFVFDKKALYKSEVSLAALLLMLFILYRKFADSYYYNYNVQVASTSYDIVITYHIFFIPIHILT